MNHESIHQNSHGVDLRTITEDSAAVVNVDGYRIRAYVLDANPVEDEYRIEVMNMYEKDVRTVSGDAFRPKKEAVQDPISDDELNSLEEGDVLSVYITGHERHDRVLVEDIDYEDNEALVRGECNNQTIHRWIPQSLIHAPVE